MTIGLIIGIIGTTLGSVIGIVFSLNIQSIQFFLEKILNVDLFAKEIYYLSSLLEHFCLTPELVQQKNL